MLVIYIIAVITIKILYGYRKVVYEHKTINN